VLYGHAVTGQEVSQVPGLCNSSCFSYSCRLCFRPLGTHTKHKLCTICLVFVCALQRRASAARTAWCTFFAHSPDGRFAHTLSHVFKPQECVWRWVCLALPLSSFTSRFLLLVACMHGKATECPSSTSYSPKVMFSTTRNTHTASHTASVVCCLACVFVYRWHCQFTARTAWCPERAAQTR
jgi:hypothetical protein